MSTHNSYSYGIQSTKNRRYINVDKGENMNFQWKM